MWLLDRDRCYTYLNLPSLNLCSTLWYRRSTFIASVHHALLVTVSHQLLFAVNIMYFRGLCPSHVVVIWRLICSSSPVILWNGFASIHRWYTTLLRRWINVVRTVRPVWTRIQTHPCPLNRFLLTGGNVHVYNISGHIVSEEPNKCKRHLKGSRQI